MAHKKGGGSTKNLRDSQPKYLGIKLSDGQTAEPGSIIIRQRGTQYLAGKNTNMGTDHTIYSRARGTVAFRTARRTRYDSRTVSKKIVDVN